MMKKSGVALAALMAIGSAAVAADVTVYGVIDTSVVGEAVNAKDGAGRVNSLYMSSGEEWGSRWGIRGTEDLGNGLTVGFDLQSGFRSDDGSLQYNRLFSREASVYVKGAFGKLTAGHMDSLIGTRTSAGKLAVMSAFGDGYGPYIPCINNVMSEYGYVDNALFYESPAMAGVTVRVQYSMGPEGTENKSNSTAASTANRYAAASVMSVNGPLTLLAGVDSVIYGHEAGVDADNSLTLTFGGKYDMGFMRLHFGAQYFDEVDSSTIRKFIWSGVPSRLKGWGGTVSAAIPVSGGDVIVAADYLDGQAADSTHLNTDVKRLILGAGYQYPVTKRTHLYAIGSWGRDEVKTESASIKPDYYKAVVGLRHLF